jgi:hypothetical protein
MMVVVVMMIEKCGMRISRETEILEKPFLSAVSFTTNPA